MLVIEPSPLRPMPRESWLDKYGLWLFLAVASVTSILACWMLRSPAPQMTLRPVANQSVREGQILSVQLTPEWNQQTDTILEFGVISGHPSASMHPQTGLWQWIPGEDAGGQTYRVKLGARGAKNKTPNAACEFSVKVVETVQSPIIEPISDQVIHTGKTLTLDIEARDPDLPGQPLTYQLAIPSEDGAAIDAKSGRFTWSPSPDYPGKDVVFQVIVAKMVGSKSVASKVEFRVAVKAATPDRFYEHLEGQKIVTRQRVRRGPVAKVASVSPATSNPPIVPAATETDTGVLEALENQYRAGTLFDPAQYSVLRRLFADRFAQEHAAELKAAFQGTGVDLERWLGQHRELRDELYVSLEPTDDVVAALKIFERLHSRSFQRLTAHPELAIALAVTWDRESGIYDYSVLQRRSHAIASSEKMCDAVANFDYYSDPEFFASGRVKNLPWEFLKHVVDHRTPLEERIWVQRNYLNSRRPIGQCYEDVAYDHGMIKSGETTSNLASRPYTLANLRDRGGICAMQADYASRVAKSLAIPAAYVEGNARNNARHAWVMWTELQPSNTAGLTFSLQSHGRFFLDRYYVGTLGEPQSGRATTDRDLEARLQGVGMNPYAYRQANLIMRLWQPLISRLKLDLEQELDAFDAVINLSPGNQAVWNTVAARMQAAGSNRDLRPRLDKLRDRCIKNFTNCPDVVCRIIDNLLQYDPDLARRMVTYERLLQLWTSTGRPDLACELRLKMTRHLTSDTQYQAALGGLAQTIKRFPDEGRHIPQLLDEYERVARNVEDGQAKVLKLYQELMPLVPRRRQGQKSRFYMEMLERAASRYAQAGQTKPAQAYADQLKKLQQER